MLLVLVLAIFLMLVWQLVKIIYTNRQNHRQLIIIDKQLQNYALLQEKNHELGQSIAALHIQLQVAQKLWQVNPKQAQQSLGEAYQLSGTVMHEVRQIVKKINV